MDSTMSHEVLTKFQEIDARLDRLEGGGNTTETEDEYVEEEEEV